MRKPLLALLLFATAGGLGAREVVNEVIQLHPVVVGRVAKPKSGFEEFFAVKRRVDPANKFRNKLWDTYYSSKP